MINYRPLYPNSEQSQHGKYQQITTEDRMSNYQFDLNASRQRGTLRSWFLAAISLLLVCSAMSFLHLTAQAADGKFSLGGEAIITDSAPPPAHRKAIQLTSVCKENCLSGGVSGELLTSSVIYLPDHTLKLHQIHTLSTDYRRWQGDCGGGSPRFEIGLDGNGDGQIDGSIFIYLGPLYNFTGCSDTWLNTGNLRQFPGVERVDSTQFGGRFYGSFEEAIQLVGGYSICYIILVVDGAWYPIPVRAVNNPNFQIFHVDNVRVNNDVLSVNQGATLNLAPPQIPTLARQNLEQYVTGRSGPRELFGFDSYYGRRYSWTNVLRSGLQSLQRRSTQNRENISITPRQ
jgi:hypothetical protein